KAGGLLDDFLAATAIPRAQLYISNVVKCRPVKPGKKPGSWVNRLPARTEISACRCHFLAELALVQPKLIVTLGATPLAVFAHQKPVMSQWHGQPFVCGQTPIFPLYHPAAVIYNRNLAQEYAADMRCLHGYLLAESLL
ncbi:MAG: uracil-DNA glycosylase, partial [Clostridiales bacterium]